MNHHFLQFLRVTYILGDVFALNLAFVINRLWHDSHIPGIYELHYSYLWILLNISWLAACWMSSVYQGTYISSFERFSRKTVHSFFFFLCGLMLYLFFWKQTNISRLFLVSMLSSVSILILTSRFVYALFFHYYRHKDYFIRRVMIIGYNETARQLANVLEEETMNTKIVGFCEDEKKVSELSHYPILSNYNNIIEESKKFRVTEIYSTVAPEHDLGIYQLMREADQACIRFKVVPDLNYFIRKPVHIDYLGNLPVLSLRKEPLDDMGSRIKKRCADLVLSSFAMIFILWWLIPIVGLLIWLEDRGPIFFIQERSGKDNQSFKCLKFRSMKVNRDAHLIQATKDDNRFTRIGKFLRKTNLDEFPQFINVLFSEMSVVGPRPHMLKHTHDYSKLLNLFMVRQFAKPGITGWAQINGYRGETRHLEDMKGRVEHDLWYMENWSLWLDLKIVFLTFFRMIKGEKNAY